MYKVNQIVLTPHGKAKVMVVDLIDKAVRVEHLETKTPITDYRFSDLKMVTKLFYIQERHNPQFKQPYYTACGQLTKKEVKAKENPIYGMNILYNYPTEQEYNSAIEKLKAKGFRVTS